jgi:hypothetical protein
MSKREVYECDGCGKPDPDIEINGNDFSDMGDMECLGRIPGGQYHRACYVRVVNDMLIPDVAHEHAEAVVACAECGEALTRLGCHDAGERTKNGVACEKEPLCAECFIDTLEQEPAQCGDAQEVQHVRSS